MKITLVIVSSLDGKTTQGTSQNTQHWSSKEDWEFFQKLLNNNNCLLMGRKTYEAAKGFMEHKSGRIRIVLTGNPEQFSSETLAEQLEFTREQPTALIQRLTDQGYEHALLLGGAYTTTEFMKENLVDDFYLTLEPKIFGAGNSFTKDLPLDITVQLLEVTKLNEKGTLLLHYQVVK